MNLQMWALASSVLATGCGDDTGAPPVGGTTTAASDAESTSNADTSSSSGGTGPVNEQPIIEAEIDAAAACAGASRLDFVATRFECTGGGPCTISDPPTETMGSSVACPATETAAAVQVGVEQTGGYRVELVTALEDGSETRACYSADGSDEVVISEGDLNAKPTIVVTPTGGACPS